MKRKGFIIIISYLSCAAIALGVYCGMLSRKSKALENSVQANYQHAFTELVTSVEEIDTALQKSLYATTPSMASSVCAEVFGKAMTAQMSLGVLPYSSQELEQTAGFISRVGDYAFALTRLTASGEPYTDEQRENLKALSGSASLLVAARFTEDIDPTTFKNWSRSEPPVLMMGERDRAAGGSGHRHLFTLRRVLQAAVTAEKS